MLSVKDASPTGPWPRRCSPTSSSEPEAPMSGSTGPSALQRAVRTYLDHLAVERGLADNTLKSYRRDLRRYVAWLADQGVAGLDGVREETVTAFLMALRE